MNKFCLLLAVYNLAFIKLDIKKHHAALSRIICFWQPMRCKAAPTGRRRRHCRQVGLIERGSRTARFGACHDTRLVRVTTHTYARPSRLIVWTPGVLFY